MDVNNTALQLASYHYQLEVLRLMAVIGAGSQIVFSFSLLPMPRQTPGKPPADNPSEPRRVQLKELRALSKTFSRERALSQKKKSGQNCPAGHSASNNCNLHPKLTKYVPIWCQLLISDFHFVFVFQSAALDYLRNSRLHLFASPHPAKSQARLVVGKPRGRSKTANELSWVAVFSHHETWILEVPSYSLAGLLSIAEPRHNHGHFIVFGKGEGKMREKDNLQEVLAERCKQAFTRGGRVWKREM